VLEEASIMERKWSLIQTMVISIKLATVGQETDMRDPVTMLLDLLVTRRLFSYIP